MGEFNGLSTEQRQALYREFAMAGARHVVVQQQAPPAGGADGWTPVRYVGWVKRLP
jgi:hypothetical protein